jgi:hypothetical protein
VADAGSARNFGECRRGGRRQQRQRVGRTRQHQRGSRGRERQHGRGAGVGDQGNRNIAIVVASDPAATAFNGNNNIAIAYADGAPAVAGPGNTHLVISRRRLGYPSCFDAECGVDYLCCFYYLDLNKLSVSLIAPPCSLLITMRKS